MGARCVQLTASIVSSNSPPARRWYFALGRMQTALMLARLRWCRLKAKPDLETLHGLKTTGDVLTSLAEENSHTFICPTPRAEAIRISIDTTSLKLTNKER